MPKTSTPVGARTPAGAAAAVLLLALAAGCASESGRVADNGPEPSAADASPSASPSPSPAADEDAGPAAGAKVPATCRGGASERAAAPYVKGLPFDETAQDHLLSCNWGADGAAKHLFVQFQTGETFADPGGADPGAEQSMGVRTTPQSEKLGGKIQYTDLGSVGRSAVLYLPGVSVTANAVGSALRQDELESIAVAAAEDLP